MQKKYIKLKIFSLIVPLSLFCVAKSSSADWQSDLEGQFDIVETFDQLQDWNGMKTEASYGLQDRPKLLDGSYSTLWYGFTNDRIIFAYLQLSGSLNSGDVITFQPSGARMTFQRIYSENGKNYIQGSSLVGQFTENDTFSTMQGASGDVSEIPKWIGNHGAQYTLGEKSLAINYYDFSGGYSGFGPSRLSAFFGDGVTGKSGYKKINIFFMMKFHPGFFKMNPSNPSQYGYVGTLKAFEIMSGMTDVDYWGTTDEYNSICDNTQGGGDCGPSPGGASCKNEYGLNADIFNLKGGGLSHPDRLFFLDIANNAADRDVCYTYDRAIYSGEFGIDIRNGEEGTIDDFYANNLWFGVEIEIERGTVDASDGYMNFYIYDSSGNETAHISFSNIDKMNFFDHYYNKFVFGGNRICDGYGTCDPNEDDRYYVDDLIIDDQRIGPTYFNLLNAIVDATAPASPNGLNVS